jgi:hypothetical protein
MNDATITAALYHQFKVVTLCCSLWQLQRSVYQLSATTCIYCRHAVSSEGYPCCISCVRQCAVQQDINAERCQPGTQQATDHCERLVEQTTAAHAGDECPAASSTYTASSKACISLPLEIAVATHVPAPCRSLFPPPPPSPGPSFPIPCWVEAALLLPSSELLLQHLHQRQPFLTLPPRHSSQPQSATQTQQNTPQDT